MQLYAIVIDQFVLINRNDCVKQESQLSSLPALNSIRNILEQPNLNSLTAA